MAVEPRSQRTVEPAPAVPLLLALSSLHVLLLSGAMVFLEMFLWEGGLSVASISTILSVYNGVSLVSYTPLGWLVDRYSRRAWIGLGLLLTGAGLSLLSFAGDQARAIGAVSVLGVGTSAFAVSVRACFADAMPRKSRGRLIGADRTLTLAAKAVAPAGAGLLFRSDIRLPFLVTGVTSTALSAVPALFLRDPATSPPGGESAESDARRTDGDRPQPSREPSSRPSQDRPTAARGIHPAAFYALVGSGFLSTFSFAGMGYMRLFMGSQQGIEPATIGLFFSVVTGALAVASVPAGWAVDRAGRDDWLMLLGCACRGLFIGLVPRASSAAPLLFALPVVGSPFIFYTIWVRKRLMDVTPPRHRGRWFSADMTASGLASTLAPLVYGRIWASCDPAWVLYMSAAAVGAAAVAALPASGARRKPAPIPAG